jgi:hypothetical protein
MDELTTTLAKVKLDDEEENGDDTVDDVIDEESDDDEFYATKEERKMVNMIRATMAYENAGVETADDRLMLRLLRETTARWLREKSEEEDTTEEEEEEEDDDDTTEDTTEEEEDDDDEEEDDDDEEEDDDDEEEEGSVARVKRQTNERDIRAMNRSMRRMAVVTNTLSSPDGASTSHI